MIASGESSYNHGSNVNTYVIRLSRGLVSEGVLKVPELTNAEVALDRDGFS